MNFLELETALTEKLNSLKGHVALYVKFLNSRETFSYNSEKQFWAASVIKVPLACTFYKKASENLIDPQERASVSKDNYVLGSGIVKLLNKETKFTYEDLITFMLTVSDNTATNEIFDAAPQEDVEKYMQSLGLNSTTCRHKMMIPAGKGPNLTTVADMGLLLEKLYKKELPYSQKILQIMTEQLDRTRIPLYIPNNISIAHENGSLEKAMHAVGVVYAKSPFVFSFLSDDQEDRSKTNKVLSECAKICFDYAPA
ncbi:hypothetical protein GF360_03105 [candidate division WWE3 bacterium]|nr:hypothetical protein [candidate division WWE3 bacterium]